MFCMWNLRYTNYMFLWNKMKWIGEVDDLWKSLQLTNELFIRPFIHSFIRSFEIVLSFIRSFIHSFVRSFLHLHWRASQVHRPLWQDRWVELFGHRVNLQVSTWLHLSAMAKTITHQPYLSIHYSSIFSNYPSIGFFLN